MAKKGQSKYMPHMRAKQTVKKSRGSSAFGRSDINLRDPAHHELPALTPGKGKHGLNCNVTACQRPNSAWWWNSSTRAWYCPDCARDIQMCNWRDAWWVQNYDYTLMTPPGESAIIDREAAGEKYDLNERFAFKRPNDTVEYSETLEEAMTNQEMWRISAGVHYEDAAPPYWYRDMIEKLRELSGKPYVDFVGNRP